MEKSNRKSGLSDEDEDMKSDDDDDDQNIIENNMTWKDNLAEKARAAYLDRQSNSNNLMKLVYGVFAEVMHLTLSCFRLYAYYTISFIEKSSERDK